MILSFRTHGCFFFQVCVSAVDNSFVLSIKVYIDLVLSINGGYSNTLSEAQVSPKFFALFQL